MGGTTNGTSVGGRTGGKREALSREQAELEALALLQEWLLAQRDAEDMQLPTYAFESELPA